MKLVYRTLICFSVLSLLIGCEKENKLEKEIAAIPIDVNVARFDQVFLNATPSDLPKLKEAYPMFFPSSIPDSTWVYTLNDPLQKELKKEVDAVFSDFAPVEVSIRSVLKHISFYFPEYELPEVFTVTTEDYRKKVILTKDMMFISLNTYLGEKHRFYEGLQKYIVQNFQKEQIPLDIASEFAYGQIPRNRERSLLSKMIYYGKLQYLKALLVPKASEAAQFGYTKTHMDWANDNETQIWRYFIEKELLYSTDSKLDNRFIKMAPFSKFYLELDNESPGGIGRYVGYKIVDAYMKNNDVSLRQMLTKSSKEIFNNSKYKPKK